MVSSEQQLIEFFKKSGADEEQSSILARQILKRAGQLSEERGITELEALEYLLKLFVEAQQH